MEKLTNTLDSMRTTTMTPQEQYNLGIHYADSKNSQYDLKRALDYFTLASNAGNTAAQYMLGTYYADSSGPDYDPKKALEYFTLASNAGDPDAQYMLGTYYMTGGNGGVVDEDYDKAVELFKRSAEQCHALAQYAMATHYLCNAHIIDEIKGIEMLIQSAENGCVDAQYELGSNYYEGEYVEKNHEKAFKYFKMAAQQGCTDSIEELKKMDEWQCVD